MAAVVTEQLREKATGREEGLSCALEFQSPREMRRRTLMGHPYDLSMWRQRANVNVERTEGPRPIVIELSSSSSQRQ